MIEGRKIRSKGQFAWPWGVWTGPDVVKRSDGTYLLYYDGGNSNDGFWIRVGKIECVRPFVRGRSVVDLNGDLAGDAFLYSPSNGYWVEAFSDGAGGFSHASGRWDPLWEVYATDLLLVGMTLARTEDRSMTSTLNTKERPGPTDTADYTPITSVRSDSDGYFAGAVSNGLDLVAIGPYVKSELSPASPLPSPFQSTGDRPPAPSHGTRTGRCSSRISTRTASRTCCWYGGRTWIQAINTNLAAFSYGTGTWDAGLTIVAMSTKVP